MKEELSARESVTPSTLHALSEMTPCAIMSTDTMPDRKQTLFERVQRMAGIGVWSLDIARKRLEWSEEVYRIFEIDPGRFEPSYEFVVSIVHPDDRSAVEDTYRTSLETRFPFSIEYRLLMPDGRIRYIREVCETCHDDEGMPVISYGTVQDVTAQKMLKEQNRIQKQQLLHQTKLAQVGEMFETIAHQWKQPLHQINSILPSLERQCADHSLSATELASKLDEIEMLTTHMAQTMDRFRHFIFLQTSETRFNVTDAIAGALALLQGELDRRGIVCKLISRESFTVSGDKEMFVQAILAILNNAKECFIHRAVSMPKIWIDIRGSGTDIMVSVSDNAGGVPEHLLNKVFDLYFTTKLNGHGTGMGLYIAKMLIEKSMQGTITVENGTQGAVFTIFLPYKEKSV